MVKAGDICKRSGDVSSFNAFDSPAVPSGFVFQSHAPDTAYPPVLFQELRLKTIDQHRFLPGPSRSGKHSLESFDK